MVIVISKNYPIGKNKDIDIETLGTQSDKYDHLIQYVSFAIKGNCLFVVRPFDAFNVFMNSSPIKIEYKMEW